MSQQLAEQAAKSKAELFAEKMLAAVNGAVLKVYPETGHSPQWEWPERFAADVEAFVGGV